MDIELMKLGNKVLDELLEKKQIIELKTNEELAFLLGFMYGYKEAIKKDKTK